MNDTPKKKILIIDDEEALTFLMTDILSREDSYSIVAAHGGREGLQMVFDERPDLVFLDYIMPDIYGDEVLKSIRQKEETRNIHVVLMSGLGQGVYFVDRKSKEQRARTSDGEERRRFPRLGRPSPSPSSFPENVITECGISGVLPKPFSAGQLVRMTKEILKDQ